MLDTNILSEVMRLKPDKTVLHWLDDQFADDLYIASITIAKIHLGIALLPDGKRKKELTLAANYTIKDFASNKLDFTEKSALEYAGIVAERTRADRPISVEDAQIAAIALANNAVLVTRNINDFDLLDGLEVINPFSSS